MDTANYSVLAKRLIAFLILNGYTDG